MKKILLAFLLFAIISTSFVLASNHTDEIDIDYHSDYKEACKLVANGDIMPLEKILQTVYKSHQGKILEVELERENNAYIYEIEILDKVNKVWELKVDAMTGKLLNVEEEY